MTAGPTQTAKCPRYLLALGRLAALVVLCSLTMMGCRRTRSPIVVEAIDITSDLYHRARAGIFRPGREPVVLEVSDAEEAENQRPYFRLRSDSSDLWVRASDSGVFVFYMNDQAFWSHWSVGGEVHSSRAFAEWPVHPIR